MKKSLLLNLAASLLLPLSAIHAIEVQNLRCEYLKDPLGIDATKPRLSWVLEDDERGQKQSAYQILVASTPEILAKDQGDLWDSGKVTGDRSNQVEYAGKPLASQAACHWKVRVWDKDGEESDWSEPALWTMGLLQPGDWTAKWIGYDAAGKLSPEEAADAQLLNLRGLGWHQAKDGKPGAVSCFRKNFEIPADRKVRRAVLVLYAYHFCEAAVNGTAIGSSAHWQSTAKLDATKALHAGKNLVTLAVSHTDPYPPAVIGKLVVQFESGPDEIVPIDKTWKAAQSPADGWQTAGFDDTAWNEAAPGGYTFGVQADLDRVPAPYLRKNFEVGGKVKRAMVYVAALGTYELRLNGKKVGNDVLAPGWPEFRKRVHYQTYDVTGQLQPCANTIGAILGDGWYASNLAHLCRRKFYGGNPRFLAQLVLEMEDGTKKVVATDADWKASYGPIRHADLQFGCEYDSRLEMPGWDTPGFDDRGWNPVDAGLASSGQKDVLAVVAAAVKDGKVSLPVNNVSLGGDPAQNAVKVLEVSYLAGGKEERKAVPENTTLELAGADLKILKATYGKPSTEGGFKIQAAMAEPSKVIQELPAVKLTEPRPGCWTFDLGQNMVGWVRLKVKGEKGQRITVRHGEMLNPDGTIYTAALRSCPATDDFILSGGEQVLEPFFTFHGFRYVEVRGLTSKPDLSTVTGIVVHSAMERTGNFESSHPMLNQLFSNIIWGQKGNYLEVPTDCPQRDERMGWTGDTQFFAPTAAYNFGVAPFFARWLQTCEDNQHASGTFPHVVPDIMGGGGATAWGDAPIICTYEIYRTYGDTRLVAERFPSLERYMQWLATKTKDGISSVGGFGDWLNAGGGAKREVIDTAYHAYLAKIMSEMAAAIGRKEDAARYAKLHDEVKAAFVREFLQPDGSIKESSQTGYALAFSMGLIPDEMLGKSTEKFVGEIQRFNWHLATGFIGTPRLLPALNAAGRNDVAYRLLLTDTYPSWLFPVKNGATTMWERWNGWTPEKGFGDISMNSYNHYAFGAVGEYLYGGVGGIQAGSPGYKTIIVKPVIDEGLDWAKTSFDSIHGPIASNWKRDGGKLTMDVAIPPNTNATVFVPAKDAASVTESGKPVGEAEGVKFLRMENNAAVYAVGSGKYQFQSQL